MKHDIFSEDERKSYANEMSETDHKMYLQIIDEKKATLNMFKVNLAFLIIILIMVLYFILGPNYILSWTDIAKDPTLHIGLTSFTTTIDGKEETNSFSCFDYNNQCKVRASCKTNLFNSDSSMKVDCNGLYQLSVIGIVFTTFLVFGMVFNILSIVSIVLVYMDNDKYSEKGITISKFEFIFYFISSIEYVLHLLFIPGKFEYRFFITIVYGCTIMSFLNIIFIRKAFYKYLILKTRANLTRLTKFDFLNSSNDKDVQ